MATLLDRWNYLKGTEAFRCAPVRTLGRLLRWRARCLARAPATVTVPACGVRLLLPPEWTGVSKLIFAFRERYEPELRMLSRFLSPGDVFVDAGASLGIYTTTAARIVGERGKVLAFEPAAAAFAQLERNIALNRLANVRAFRLALTDRFGPAVLVRHADASRNSLGGDGGAGFEPVETAPLDEVLEREGAGQPSLIKIDVEGAEELVLRGARRTLLRSRPVVLFEANPKAARDLGLEEAGSWRLLAGLGYRFFKAAAGRLKAIGSPPAGGNLVALP